MEEKREKVILLVEDNPDDEELTLRALAKCGINNKVVVCRDGADALNYIFGRADYKGRNPADYPAITLLDLKLPKVDGLTVLERVRGDSRTRLMPVAVLTSSRLEEDLIRSYQLGVNSYVRKPVKSEQFVEAIRQLGLYWLLLNESPPSRVEGHGQSGA
ncbi:response regulator [candidate division WOR-3 bacterium]|nr:response regulator [candidate division WOR-3 bacterium]